MGIISIPQLQPFIHYCNISSSPSSPPSPPGGGGATGNTISAGFGSDELSAGGSDKLSAG